MKFNFEDACYFLIDDELEAIKGYDQVINQLRKDPNQYQSAIQTFIHIREEEKEHLEEIKEVLYSFL